LIDRFLRLRLSDVQSMRAHARQLHGERFNSATAAADLLDVLEKAARTRAVRGSR